MPFMNDWVNLESRAPEDVAADDELDLAVEDAQLAFNFDPTQDDTVDPNEELLKAMKGSVNITELDKFRKNSTERERAMFRAGHENAIAVIGEKRALTAEIAQIRNSIPVLESNIASLESRTPTLASTQTLASYRERLTAANNRIAAAEQRIGALDGELALDVAALASFARKPARRIADAVREILDPVIGFEGSVVEAAERIEKKRTAPKKQTTPEQKKALKETKAAEPEVENVVDEEVAEAMAIVDEIFAADEAAEAKGEVIAAVVNQPEPAEPQTTEKAKTKSRVRKQVKEQLKQLTAAEEAAALVREVAETLPEPPPTFTDEDLEPLFSGETVEYVNSKGETKTVGLLKTDRSGFLTDEDFELFNDLLEKGQAPKNQNFYNQRITSRKWHTYTIPFKLTLQREVEKRYPTRPKAPPIDTGVDKAEVKKALSGAVTVTATDRPLKSPEVVALYDERDRIAKDLHEFSKQLKSLRRKKASTKEMKPLDRRVKLLSDKLVRVDNYIADLYRNGYIILPRSPEFGDVQAKVLETTKRVKKMGTTMAEGLSVVQEGDALVGYFTNNPYETADLISRGFPVYVPTSMRKTRNPNIKINSRGYVTKVELAEYSKPIEKAGDINIALDYDFTLEENEDDFIEFTGELPPVTAASAAVLGNTLDGRQPSSLTTEDDYIAPAMTYLSETSMASKAGQKNAAVRSMLENTPENLQLFQSAVLHRYLKSLREFAMAARVRNVLAKKGNVVSLMRSMLTVDGEIPPAIKRTLKKRFGKSLSDDDLLRNYAIRLDNELGASYTAVETVDDDIEPETVEEAEARREAGEFAGDSKRWKHGKPESFVHTYNSVATNLRKKVKRRAPVLFTQLATESGEEVTLTQQQQDEAIKETSSDIAAAMEASFLLSEAPITEREIGEVNRNTELRQQLEQALVERGVTDAYTRETGELIRMLRDSMRAESVTSATATGDPFADARTTDQLIEVQVARIDADPNVRAAFERMAAVFGVSDVTNRSTRELFDLLRGERNALRNEADAAFKQQVSEISALLVQQKLAGLSKSERRRVNMPVVEATAQTEAERSMSEFQRVGASLAPEQRAIVQAYIRPVAEFAADVRQRIEARRVRDEVSAKRDSDRKYKSPKVSVETMRLLRRSGGGFTPATPTPEEQAAAVAAIPTERAAFIPRPAGVKPIILPNNFTATREEVRTISAEYERESAEHFQRAEEIADEIRSPKTGSDPEALRGELQTQEYLADRARRFARYLRSLLTTSGKMRVRMGYDITDTEFYSLKTSSDVASHGEHHPARTAGTGSW